MEKYEATMTILAGLIPYTILHVIKIVLLVKILNLLKQFKKQNKQKNWNWDKFVSVPCFLLKYYWSFVFF